MCKVLVTDGMNKNAIDNLRKFNIDVEDKFYDGMELAELEAVEVSEAGSEESKVDGVEVAESDTDEVQKSGAQPQGKEHRQTVMEKSEKTQEAVLFDKQAALRCF